MKVHEKVKTEPLGPLNCLECGKTFEIKKYLTAHMKTHLPKDDSNGSQEKKKCHICPYETNRNFNLKMHMKSHKKDQNKKNLNEKIKLVIFALLQPIKVLH